MAVISEKTKKFIRGRIGQFPKIEKACEGVDNIIWVHAASYGEFEEARPVIQSIRNDYPEMKILATFFSPSGYDYLKDDPLADWVFYLPLSTGCNARRFLDAVRPVKAIFSISDYWPSFLKELRRRRIDTYLISARFIDSMIYFKPIGAGYRKLFRTCFTKIMVSNMQSLELLRNIGVTRSLLVGDPRMDRVMTISAEDWHDPLIEEWLDGAKAFVAGSTLPIGDDELIISLANAYPDDRFIIVPHDIDDRQISHIRASINGKSALYTDGSESCMGAQVLIVNTVGILSRIYRYGFAAYVGAGFDGGPHSIIEAASYGIPVVYGPQFGCNWHCGALIEAGGGYSVSNAQQICGLYGRFRSDCTFLEESGNAARRYCEDGSGVAARIAAEIMSNGTDSSAR